MASKHTVTLDNLAALGPERLAAILIELADGDAEVSGACAWNLPHRPAGTPSRPRSASASPPCGPLGPSSIGRSGATSYATSTCSGR